MLNLTIRENKSTGKVKPYFNIFNIGFQGFQNPLSRFSTFSE